VKEARETKEVGLNKEKNRANSIKKTIPAVKAVAGRDGGR
jgi:hypothetical protein